MTDNSYADNSYAESLCGRCLVITDNKTLIRAFKPGSVPAILSPNFLLLNTKSLAEWVVGHLASGYHIETENARNTFDPVNTWNGDNVCIVHLWELRERELRNSK